MASNKYSQNKMTSFHYFINIKTQFSMSRDFFEIKIEGSVSHLVLAEFF